MTIMTNTLPKMHTCKNCGFMSMQENVFEMLGKDKLCRFCFEQIARLFYFEAGGDNGLIPGRNKSQAHESLCSKIVFEDILVFREATEEDIARVEAKSGRATKIATFP